MKSYTITVNGNVYDVIVEEKRAMETPAPKTVQAAPQLKVQAAPVKKAPADNTGSIAVKANVPGKIFKIEASVGQPVKKGQNLMILEAMKMEIPVVAPEDGVVASINVAVGDSIETGDVLASLK